MFYDAILLAGVLFIATALLLPFRSGEAFGPQHFAYDAYLFGVGFLYYGWFWTHGGQTLGMRAWQMRVLADAGGTMTWTRATVRFLVAILSLSLFGLGFWWSLWDIRERCWHDRLSRTHLVRQDWSGHLPSAQSGDGDRCGQKHEHRG